MNIRVEHSWSPDDLVRRIQGLAEKHGVAVEAIEGGASGRLAHSTPLGEVRASYRITATVLEVQVEKKPAFLPADMVKRRLKEELQRMLAER